MEVILVKTSKFASISNECHQIDVVDSLVQRTISNNVFMILLSTVY